MNRDEKKLYQANTLSNNLVMIFVLLNTVHAIFTIQHMNVNWYIGIFIMITIFLSMISFLTAVKLKTYSMIWSYIAIGIGVFQFIKLLFSPKEIEGNMKLYLTVILVISIPAIIAGACVSIVRINKRTSYLNNHYTGNEVMH